MNVARAANGENCFLANTSQQSCAKQPTPQMGEHHKDTAIPLA